MSKESFSKKSQKSSFYSWDILFGKESLSAYYYKDELTGKGRGEDNEQSFWIVSKRRVEQFRLEKVSIPLEITIVESSPKRASHVAPKTNMHC